MARARAAIPAVALLPYLPLAEPVRFNGYRLGPLGDFGGPWDSRELEAATAKFAALFVDGSGRPVERPTLLASEQAGVDGSLPDIGTRQALIGAIGFAVIDANPLWSEESARQGWSVATADNADLWFQPIDLDTGSIATAVGSKVQTLRGGGTLDGPPIPPPVELHLGVGRRKLDEELLDALHRVLSGSTPTVDRGRLQTAIRWHLKAWFNSGSISDEDRILFLKVAFEGLSGTEKSTETAKRLNLLFGSTMEQEGSPIGIDALLWSPWEPTLARSHRSQVEDRQLFEHWFMAFASARNEIIHSGRVARTDYSEPTSPYTGPLVETADRVVREAIKVMLGRCGFPAVWRSGFARAALRAANHLRELSDE